MSKFKVIFRGFGELAAFLTLASIVVFSGCDRRKPEEKKQAASRHDDGIYINEVKGFADRQRAIAAERVKLQEMARKISSDPAKKAEYLEVSNRLARCLVDERKAREAAVLAVRARILKETKDRKEAAPNKGK